MQVDKDEQVGERLGLEPERAAFEAWLVQKGGWVAVPKKRSTGTYISGQAQARWIGWQAAAAAERERLCAAIKAADDKASEGDYMLDSDDCISVIRGTWNPGA